MESVMSIPTGISLVSILFFGVLVADLVADGVVNLALKVKREMFIENLDFEPKINAMMRETFEAKSVETSPCFGERFTLMLREHQDVISEFRSPPRWKELSKETGSKILPSGDGSCRKTFKPIASFDSERKIEINAGASFPYLQHQG
ncbi:hypothetical protein Tco_0781334 [Tanacetum coccineum]